jgi:hypothetical protein
VGSGPVPAEIVRLANSPLAPSAKANPAIRVTVAGGRTSGPSVARLYFKRIDMDSRVCRKVITMRCGFRIGLQTDRYILAGAHRERPTDEPSKSCGKDSWPARVRRRDAEY